MPEITENRGPKAVHADAHAHGPGRYFVVWILLLIFTGTTVITGRMDLGDFNIVLALVIASVKAALVVLFFMHMTEAAGTNRLIFVVSVIFTVVMMIGVFGDLLTRNPMTLPTGNPPAQIQAE
ncbi:MAG TPA: cytochrome C oxidase subunit IV family protein [Polyangia bacterium]|nr:cytochrome C oxidase subunit IV family protein [Polyangia bacterium]